MRDVMGHASESKIWAAYINGQEAIPICTSLGELGHKQTPTEIQVEKFTAEGFDNDTIKQKISKAINMQFYWIKERTRQIQSLVYCRTGSTNIGDYHTKNNYSARHHRMRPNFMHT